MMAAFNGTTFPVGQQVSIHGRVLATVKVIARDATTGEATGLYLVDTQFGKIEQRHHWELEEVPAFGSSCAACGSTFNENDERAEVVNKTTGARGVVHVEEFLADTCCYDLA